MRIGKVIRKWRVSTEVTIRDLAKEMGLDAATLLRVEQDKEPSSATLKAILFWLLLDSGKVHGVKRSGKGGRK